jgi:hypothetical protein
MRDGAHFTWSNPHMNEMSILETASGSSRIRKRGLGLFAVGSVFYVMAIFVMDRLRVQGGAFHYVLLPACVVFGVACIGFVELVSGAPCYRLRRAWAQLRGWQCVMIGTFVVVASLVVVLCIGTFLILSLT